MEKWAILLLWIIILLIPVAMSVLGIIVLVKKPKQNRVFGYRTKRTFSDERAWELANKLWGKCALIFGLLTSIVLIPILYYTIPKHFITGCVISAVLIVIANVIPIIIVEVIIRKKIS